MNNLPSFVRNARLFVLPALISSLCFFSGCGDDEIEVYDAPRPAIASDMPAHDPNDGQDHSGHAHAQQQAPPSTKAPGGFNITLPQGWQQVQPGRMILHSFSTPSGAMVNVSAFPGDVGGVVMNVNRWRGQLGLGAATEEQINSALKADKLGSVDAQRVDLANASQRLIVTFGMVDGKTWFIKFTGTTEQIDEAMSGFDQFVKSVNWK